MTDSSSMRAVGGDPHYTRMCAQELVDQIRTALQPLVEAGAMTAPEADKLAASRYAPVRSVLLKLAWFYYTEGIDRGHKENLPVPPPLPILPHVNPQTTFPVLPTAPVTATDPRKSKP